MFPLRHTVDLLTTTAAGEDEFGLPIETGTQSTTYKVYGWAPVRSDEPRLAGRDAVTVEVELFAPATFPAQPHDRVLLGGRLFEVIGHAEDYNHGPFGFQPGLVVNLRRVEG
ncbi:hypothetical protein [Rhodococcus triatomae]|nr:hypothetical protein G419_25302 [Rhodococcus triatomae BKS 15-14]